MKIYILSINSLVYYWTDEHLESIWFDLFVTWGKKKGSCPIVSTLREKYWDLTTVGKNVFNK